jgi:hypothetical protein
MANMFNWGHLQEYWTLKARLREENEERLRRSLYATQSDIEQNKWVSFCVDFLDKMFLSGTTDRISLYRKQTLEVIQICEKEKQAVREKQKVEEAFWDRPTLEGKECCEATLRPWTVASNSVSPSTAVCPSCSVWVSFV